MSIETTINLIDNGPLIVKDPPSLRHRGGDAVKTDQTAVLCRCGASKNKPFCDGSHTAAEFSSQPDHSKIRNNEISYSGTIEGREVSVYYTPVLCSHAGQCAKHAKAVFDPSAKPWIQPENGKLDDILKVMANCPSGALRVSIGEQSPQHLSCTHVEIEIEQHGPYWVKNVPLQAEFNGVGASRVKYVLCRCGHSKNKPFCDGSHYEMKWRDDA